MFGTFIDLKRGALLRAHSRLQMCGSFQAADLVRDRTLRDFHPNSHEFAYDESLLALRVRWLGAAQFLHAVGQHRDGLIEIDGGKVRGRAFQVDLASGDIPDRKQPTPRFDGRRQLLQQLCGNLCGEPCQICLPG